MGEIGGAPDVHLDAGRPQRAQHFLLLRSEPTGCRLQLGADDALLGLVPEQQVREALEVGRRGPSVALADGAPDVQVPPVQQAGKLDDLLLPLRFRDCSR